MPKRLHRHPGQPTPQGAVLVDHTTPYANPLIVEPRLARRPEAHPRAGETIPGKYVYDVRNHHTGEQRRTGDTQAYAHRFATDKYETEILYHWITTSQINLDPLRGRDLACVCPTDVDCHADVLLEYAAHPDPTRLARARKSGRNPKQYHHREEHP